MSSSFNPIVITSSANPNIKRLVRMRDNRARRRMGRFCVDGWRESARAIQAGVSLSAVYTTAESLETDASQWGSLVLQAAQSQEALYVLDPSVMQKIGYGDSHRGVVTEFHDPGWRLERLRLPTNAVIMVLDRIEKPGNVGAVFRCADAAGIDAVVLCDALADLFNPNVIRSSLGTVFTVPTAVATFDQCSQYLIENQIQPLAARVEVATSIWDVELEGNLALVFGNEAEGLGDRWQRLSDGSRVESATIPMFGDVDSLNISVSAALLAFEVRRRRASR